MRRRIGSMFDKLSASVAPSRTARDEWNDGMTRRGNVPHVRSGVNGSISRSAPPSEKQARALILQIPR
jgi:hypothetical protein